MPKDHAARLPILAIAAILTACGGPGDEHNQSVTGAGTQRIDTAMTSLSSRYSPLGIAVAVVKDGRLLFANAYGSADRAGNEPLRPDHLFRIASISKPVTGIATLRAIEEGLLSPDSAVFDVLEEYLPSSGADPRLSQISVRHLMHHTSGWTMAGHPTDPLFRSREIAQATGSTLPPDPGAMTRWAAMQPLSFNPGSDFFYTNIGYVVLGRVLERSTGFDYEDLVRNLVLNPAGISRAQLGGITRADRKQDEVEYESTQNGIWTSVFDGSTLVPEPAYGGINLVGLDASSAWLFSVVDLAKLASATDGHPGYADIISEQSFELMTKVGTPSGTTPVGVAWFLGIDSTGRVTKWDHGGGMPGTIAYLARLESGTIIVAVSNSDPDGSFFQDLATDLTDAVNGIDEWPTTDLFPLYP